MQKIALGIEYDGTHYHGWQRQPDADSVQSCVEYAISKIAKQSIPTICAGRTDASVHALGQVVHFETSVMRPMAAWKLGVNMHLPRDIRIHWAQEVADDFSARFSATARYYRYVICNQAVRPAIKRHHVSWEYHHLDETKMIEAAQYFLGEHDFSSFRAAECQSKTAIRQIHELNIKRNGINIIIDIKANAFLHHMVRNMVGVLIEIGRCRKPPVWVKEVLHARDRKAAAVTAPAQGLYLVDVTYPEIYNIPKTIMNIDGCLG